MADLDHNVAAKLLAIKEKKDQESAKAGENIQEESQTPVEQPKETKAEAVPASQPKAEKQTEETSETAETPAAETTEPVEEFRWDADIVEETPKEAVVDVKKIGSALNFEVNTEEELIKQVSEKMAKLKELEAQTQTTFEGVPDELKEAIDIAKKGGDWYTFIEHSLLDVQKLDPIDLFEQEFERLEAAKYKNPDGTIDYEKLDEALDQIPDAVKAMQGKAIRDNLYLRQMQKKTELRTQAEKSQEVFKSQLSEAMKELPNYFPQDTFGVKIEPQHVSSLYDGITSTKLVQKHLGITDPTILSKIDPKKLARTLAMAEWSAGISKAQYNRGLVQAKKELLEKTQNAQINTSSKSAEPEYKDGEKPQTPSEKLRKAMMGRVPERSL